MNDSTQIFIPTPASIPQIKRFCKANIQFFSFFVNNFVMTVPTGVFFEKWLRRIIHSLHTRAAK